MYVCQSLFLSFLCWLQTALLAERMDCAVLARDPRTSSTFSLRGKDQTHGALKQRRNHNLQFSFVLEGQRAKMFRYGKWSPSLFSITLQALARTGLRAVPVLYRGVGLRWPTRVPSNSTDSTVVWFHFNLSPMQSSDPLQADSFHPLWSTCGQRDILKLTSRGGKGLTNLLASVSPPFLPPWCQLCVPFFPSCKPAGNMQDWLPLRCWVWAGNLPLCQVPLVVPSPAPHLSHP